MKSIQAIGFVERSPKRIHLLIVSAAILLHIGVSLTRLYDSYFFSDDFFNDILQKENAGNWHYFFWAVYGQTVPLYRAAHLIFFQIFGLNHGAVIFFTLLMSSSVVGFIGAIVRRARAPVGVAAALVGIAATSLLPIEPQRWWSAGLHSFPGTIAALACIFIAADPASRLRSRQALAAAAIYTIGLGFYAKTLILIIPFIAIRLFVRVSRKQGDDIVAHLMGALRDSAPMMPVAALYLIAASLVAIKHGATGLDLASVPAVIKFTLIGLQYGMISALAGFHIVEATPGFIMFLGALVADIALGGAVFVALRRNSAALWLWGGLAVTLIAGIVIIGLARAAIYGPWSAVSGRYTLDGGMMILAFVSLGLGHAYAGRSVVTPRKTEKVFLAVSLPAMMLALWTGTTYPAVWDTVGVRQFMSTFRTSYAREAQKSAPILGERIMPALMTPTWMIDYTDLGHFAGLLIEAPRVAPWDQATHIVLDGGEVISLADLPRLRLNDASGTSHTISIAPSFEGQGHLDLIAPKQGGRIYGWLDPRLGKRLEVWAVIGCKAVVESGLSAQRNDVAAYLGRPLFARGGFETYFDSSPTGQVAVVGVIDRRIAITLSGSSLLSACALD